jgi:hypothetical protein
MQVRRVAARAGFRTLCPVNAGQATSIVQRVTDGLSADVHTRPLTNSQRSPAIVILDADIAHFRRSLNSDDMCGRFDDR